MSPPARRRSFRNSTLAYNKFSKITSIKYSINLDRVPSLHGDREDLVTIGISSPDMPDLIIRYKMRVLTATNITVRVMNSTFC